MQQLDRRKESLPDIMRKALDVRHAANVLNRCIHEEGVSMQAERVALAIYAKTVPSLAAIHMEVADNRPQSVHDLNTMLVLNGLDALTGESQVIDTIENSSDVEEESETGAPPDAEA
jgi:hypothetical protein